MSVLNLQQMTTAEQCYSSIDSAPREAGAAAVDLTNPHLEESETNMSVLNLQQMKTTEPRYSSAYTSASSSWSGCC